VLAILSVLAILPVLSVLPAIIVVMDAAARRGFLCERGGAQQHDRGQKADAVRAHRCCPPGSAQTRTFVLPQSSTHSLRSLALSQRKPYKNEFISSFASSACAMPRCEEMRLRIAR